MCPKETALCELYKNAKCKVPNNMIEICVTDSKNYVMCSGRGSLEEQWWIGDKLQVTRWGERLWMPKMKENKVTQKMFGWVCTMALNAKSGKCDSECHTEAKAWTPNRHDNDRSYRCGPRNWTDMIMTDRIGAVRETELTRQRDDRSYRCGLDSNWHDNDRSYRCGPKNWTDTTKRWPIV